MKSRNEQHERFMRECFRLARRGEGYVSPNPMVGAVLVKRGRIVARGYHKKFGGPHAEVFCLGQFKGSLKGATLYVNLEPCCYHGKTPACTELLIRSGVEKVVVGMRDPNPRVSGGGIQVLRQAGVKVIEGVLEKKALQLNRKFSRLIVARRPYVHLKIAQTLDARIAGPNSKGRWISSAASRRLVHDWRREYDAVLVGAGTIRADNPRLTVRLTKGRDPDVIVLDGGMSVASSVAVFSSGTKRRVFLCVSKKAALRESRKVKQLTDRSVDVIALAAVDGMIPIRNVLKELYRRHVGSILVEGGRQVFTSFLREGLVDLMSVFISPSIMGAGTSALDTLPKSQIANLQKRSAEIYWTRVDKDILLQIHFE